MAARIRQAGVNSSQVTVGAHNPVTHRYWRIQHTGTSVSFRTSPDGTTWTTHGTLTTTLTSAQLSTLRSRMEAGHWAAETVPGSFKVTQLGPAPLAGAAAISVTTAGNLGVTSGGGGLATIAYRDASTATTGAGTGTSLACTVPAATVTGDLMLAALYVRAQETITDPSGWTRVTPSGSDGSGHMDDSGMRSVLYQRIATSTDETDATSYTWAWTSAVKAVVLMAAYSGADPAAPLVQAVAANEPGTALTAHATGSVTTTSANDLLVSMFGTTSSSAWTADAADTERAETASSGTGPISGMLADSGTAPGTGSYTRTASQTGTTSAGAFYLLALKPAGTAGGPQALAGTAAVSVSTAASLGAARPLAGSAAVTAVTAGMLLGLGLDVQLQAAQPGDTIYFSGDQAITKTYTAGTQAQPIRVVGVGGARILGSTQSTGNGFEVLHDWYALEGFTIQNTKKGLYVMGASHGRLDRVTVKDTGDEGFKWRRSSQYWYAADCVVENTGNLTNGEGFYIGDSSQNWVNATTPDVSGYITLIRPVARKTRNDAFDCKEGSHHVKIKGADVDFSVVAPPDADSQGDSGVYIRSNDMQVIDTLVHGNPGSGVGFKVAQTTLNSVHYGDRVEFKHAQTASQAGAMFEVASPTSDIEIYDDYVNGSAGGLVIGSGTTPSGPPSG
jgi:hypothetical protein